MLIENVDAIQSLSTYESYPGYWNWEITADATEQLGSMFRKILTCETEFSGYPKILIEQIFKEDLTEALDLFQRHVDSKGEIPYKIKLRYHKSGSTLHILCKGKIIEWDEAGKPLRMTGCNMDITEVIENKNELELKKYQQELERNEFLLNEMAKMAKVGGWEYDLSTGAISWTKETYDIHEVPTDIIPNMQLLNSLYTEEAREVLHNAIKEAIEQKKEYDLELLSVTFLGQKKWVRAIGKPAIDNNGAVVGLRGTVQDIDEKKLQDMELQKSTDIINTQNQRLYNFAHIVTHNLRTHAGNIGSILSLIEISEEPEEKDELITSLYRISSALNDTLEHLNDVAKIQTEINATKVNKKFEEVFNKIVDVLKPTINETGTSIKADFSEANEILYIPAYLESIMLNLISNAIKYKHPERRPDIAVKSFTRDNRIFLEVTDNGLGINLVKVKDKLFGMYKTFHAHPDARGIGLFITKNQVEAFGGTITVESELGQGSTFLVQF